MTTLDEQWRADAACKGLSLDLFFPERGERVADAVAVCEACPVQLECLEHALDMPERVGIWGGYSENQRRRMRVGRPRRAICGHCFRAWVGMPGRSGQLPPTCPEETCRREYRLSQKRPGRARQFHAHRERSRSAGDVTLDNLEDGAA